MLSSSDNKSSREFVEKHEDTLVGGRAGLLLQLIEQICILSD